MASYAGPPADPRALNALLPSDVSVLASERAPADFSARHDATSRAYRYRLLTRAARSPFGARTSLHWPQSLDDAALRACAVALRGPHDFTAFTPTETSHVRFERTVHQAAWRQDGDQLEFVIEADAFLRHMVRVLLGTMLEVGGGRRTPAQFTELLAGRPRADAGATAPPRGLTLLGVGYGGRSVLVPDGLVLRRAPPADEPMARRAP